MNSRTLVMMRHGHAAGLAPRGDRSRSLSASGREEVRRMGQLLADRGFAPDVALVSDADRTRQTWAGLQQAGVGADDEQVTSALYNADADDIVALLQELPDDATTVLVVAHFPGIPDTVLDIAAERGDEDAWDRMRWGYPTAGVATLRFDGAWRDLTDAEVELVAFDTP